ncbi:hypothetical protein CcaverHIS002_0700400 [Cutaneotrichosporon cavernicola]|uniref:Uncharacterized protein n=1 Tax=Cutaneotrichosporon cavernicola TaxID=279322 RepID=A0AA48QYA6_9TREE|nr:uncharacterized protein CcaverHIS019_0700410 [Cutaneotrichosporon cavernicola]BEI86694.1 hypothetical protein CcaverHIS002_0700400 [Cutaneotrichosporon cavernicola]BEI94469.1 hypothetical protein CcaverHIS019_0700410 [Cutaneotrichosporon cavernicola]BEJ02245.1 hypothetical protein CcaverHIS631_0700400 [Cutaneotrichosporon cavernicola]BEJ10004.1 hypothetical protein CcaverHIS641_0700390 [Cutaneotrichosporon cavernicola]
MAASMDDLVSTLNGSMHVGQQAADLKELHAALAQTLQQPRVAQTQRPIPPTTKLGPHSDGPVPPPAPVSSWNDAVSPQPIHLLSGNNWTGGMGNSPRQVTTAIQQAPINNVQFTGKRTTGFTPPPPSEKRPHHDDVLPNNASPRETTGFAQDAFRPLWDKQPQSPYHGFAR